MESRKIQPQAVLHLFKNASAFLLRDARHAMHDKKMTTKSETNDKDAENKEKG